MTTHAVRRLRRFSTILALGLMNLVWTARKAFRSNRLR